MITWLVNALLDRPRHPARAFVLIVFVSFGRLLLETMLQANGPMKVSDHATIVHNIADSLIFYTYCLVAIGTALSWTTGRPFAEVANVVGPGLVLGLLPPIMELFVTGASQPSYRYFSEIRWTYSGEGQPFAEMATVWIVIASAGMAAWAMTRRVWRGVLASALVYVIGFYSALPAGVEPWAPWLPGGAAAQRSHILWSGAVLTMAIVVASNARRMGPSLARWLHAGPFVGIALWGGALAGRPVAPTVADAMGVALVLLVVVLQNDVYDRVEDVAGGRVTSGVDGDDAAWFGWIGGLLCAAHLLTSPVAGFPLTLILVLGLMYHHPLFRWKKAPVMAYVIEGLVGLLAFVAGSGILQQWRGRFDGHVLVALTGVAVALASVVKDWKDVEQDRASSTRTIYVWLSDRTRRVTAVHRAWSVLLCAGLLVPPILVFLRDGWISGWTFVGFVAPLICVAGLWSERSRGRGMRWFLLGMTLYLVSLYPEILRGQIGAGTPGFGG